MSPREVEPPGEPYRGRHRVYSTVDRNWQKLCRSHPGVVERVYRQLADNPYPPSYRGRHHRMAGRLKDHWEFEVSGGHRVRYKRGPDGDPIVTYAGPAPPDTH